jgi:hypothetical protein
MKLFTPKISLLICVVCLIFVSSLTAANPYNALDVAALKAFFEQPSAVQNKTNGEQLGLPASLPDDDSWIATLAGRIRWGAISGDVTQEQRLRAFNVVNANLSGMLDLRVCYWLEELNCPNNRLTGLKLSELSAQLLRSLNTDGNCLRLVELPLLGWDYGRQYIAGETINYDNGDTMDFSDSMVIGGKNTDFIVSSGGNTLVETVDYTMENGILRIINPNLIGQTLSVYLINESFIYPNTMEVHLVRFTGTPATYHPDDVQALRTFLEQRSLTGPP